MKKFLLLIVLFTCSGILAAQAQTKFDSTSLPVTLLYFKATPKAQAISLEWATAKEWSFSHYLVERSGNGSEFEPLQRINAEATESSNTKYYQLLDRNPQRGANYYRLASVDVDGTREDKGTVLAYFHEAGNLQVLTKNGYITIYYPGATENTWLIIGSITGQELMRLKMPGKELTFPVSALPPGLHYVKVATAFEQKRIKLLIR